DCDDFLSHTLGLEFSRRHCKKQVLLRKFYLLIERFYCLLKLKSYILSLLAVKLDDLLSAI
ncbi:MAG: hypothetical protein ACJ707_04410, partial [Nitrososphaera sp.]